MTSQPRAHAILDVGLALAIVATALLLGDPKKSFHDLVSFIKRFPDHYEPVFDFIQSPMDPTLAVNLWLIDMYFLLKTYYVERMVVANAHKKYTAHKTTAFVAVHGIGSSLEFCFGLLAVLFPDSRYLAYATACLALFVNVPSGFMLSPRVFGVKCLTVPGFFKFGLLRSMEALRVFFVHHKLVANLWILLHVGTVVRLLGYFVLPYSSTDGKRGDLFTEPVMYSFNILLSGYLTAAFVYPLKFLLGSLIVYVLGQVFYPPKISMKWRGVVEDATAATGATSVVNGGNGNETSKVD